MQTAMEMRDLRIKVEYLVDKQEIAALARLHGMSEKRITQILQEQGVTLRKRTRDNTHRPISRLHERIGLRLYDFRVENEISLDTASIDLQMSKIRLRRIEKGEQILDILDVQNIAAYLGTSVTKLLGEKDG